MTQARGQKMFSTLLKTEGIPIVRTDDGRDIRQIGFVHYAPLLRARIYAVPSVQNGEGRDLFDHECQRITSLFQVS